jgi:hypothetical protein
VNGYGLTQYGVDGLTRFYSAVNDDSSPPASLGLVDLGLEINQLTFHTINRPSGMTQPDGSRPTPIYMVVLPPSYTTSLGSGGFHAAWIGLYSLSDLAEGLIVGAATSGDNTLNGLHDQDLADIATTHLSHEIAEATTDPVGGYVNPPDPFPRFPSPFAAILATPGTRWGGTPSEIGDFEPDGN